MLELVQRISQLRSNVSALRREADSISSEISSRCGEPNIGTAVREWNVLVDALVHTALWADQRPSVGAAGVWRGERECAVTDVSLEPRLF